VPESLILGLILGIDTCGPSGSVALGRLAAVISKSSDKLSWRGGRTRPRWLRQCETCSVPPARTSVGWAASWPSTGRAALPASAWA